MPAVVGRLRSELRRTGRDRYGRDLGEVRRQAEAAATYAAQLGEAAAAFEDGRLERGRELSSKTSERLLRQLEALLERLAERDRAVTGLEHADEQGEGERLGSAAPLDLTSDAADAGGEPARPAGRGHGAGGTHPQEKTVV